MEAFPYVIKNKKESVNIVVDALSQRYTLISVFHTRLIGFRLIVELYKKDPYFAKVYEKCTKGENGGYLRQEGFFFKFGRLCIPFFWLNSRAFGT